MKQLKPIARYGLYALGAFALWQIGKRSLRKVWHIPAPWYIGRLLDSDLRRLVEPARPIITRSGIQPGMKILEVGCGSGAYTTFVARAVGPTGEVHALDLQPAMLEQLARKLERPEYHDITNIHLHESPAYPLPFEDDTLDLVYMIAVLQEIPDRRQALAEAYRVLRPGGTLAITEWLVDPDYALSGTTVRAGLRAGFTAPLVQGNLWTYTARFGKPIEIA